LIVEGKYMVYIAECPGCGESFPAKGQQVYCSLACSQTAELVRYARRKRLEGTFDRADVAEAIAIRLSQIVVNGGYDKRAREITDELRKEIMARAGGKCEHCGKPFETEGDYRATIQHCKGASNRVEDLRAWCYRCNMDHAQSVPITLTDEQVLTELGIIARWEAPEPLRICDDPEQWPKVWRQYPVRLDDKEYEDLDDYYDRNCPYNTGSADGDAYFEHAMSKDD
jgi:5-methylcytosine-specific restriction endonuclease McrA